MRIQANIGELRQICQASHTDAGIEPFLYLQIRKMSIYLTWVLLHLPLSANQVSLLMIATGLLASALFALNYLIAAIIALALFVLLDFCDGEVARYRRQPSIEGVYLDQIAHFWVHPNLLAGITLGVYQVQPSIWIVIVGFIAAISCFVLDMVQWYAEHIVLWLSLKGWLKYLNTAKEAGSLHRVMDSGLTEHPAVQGTAPISSRLLERAKQVGLRRIIERIARYWHFPYIVFAISLAAIIQLFFLTVNIADLTITPLALFVLFSAATFPAWTLMFLAGAVLRRSATKNYDLFVRGLVSLMARMASNADRSETIVQEAGD